MKSPQAVTDDSDDMFGPPRTYEMGYCPPKNRPSMISAKYRQKEERRKVLKISINKLKKIEDPEASLCRSVLINNTMKRLQKEARDEKIQKQQVNYPRCYDNDNYLNLKSEFIKNELKSSFEEPRDFTPNDAKIVDCLSADFGMDGEFHTKICDDIDESVDSLVRNGLVDCASLGSDFCSDKCNSDSNISHQHHHHQPSAIDSNEASRKRSIDDIEDCDVQHVLSQFYMPPTPRLLTCIDDDEDVNVVDVDEPATKRAKLDDINQMVANSDNSSDVMPRLDDFIQKSFEKEDYSRMHPYTNNNLPVEPVDSRLRYVPSTQSMDVDSNAFSCGHASMFNDIQNNVFHNLITSLES